MKDRIAKALNFIDTWLELKYRQTTYPGFSICVSHQGNTIRELSFGTANLDEQIRLRPDHIFRIGSLSKTYTALALMQLHEKKLLDIENPVIHYLPWIGDHKDPRWKAITITELMSHTAGLCRNGLDSDCWLLSKDFPEDKELPAVVAGAELVEEGKSKSIYSNLGYAILGQVIAAVSMSSYDDYVVRNIIEPMHLPNTGSDFSPSISKRLVSGHSIVGENRARATVQASARTKAMTPAGGFYSTAQDVCKFYNALLPGQNGLISEESKKVMQMPRGSYYSHGLGLDVIYHSKNSFAFGHSGSFPGQQARVICVPGENLIVAALANCPDASVWDMAHGIVKIFETFLGKQKEPKRKKSDYSKFEGCFENFYGMAQIVCADGALLSVDPQNWYPFKTATKLIPVTADMLKFSRSTGFNEPYNLIRYKFDQNDFAESISYAASTMTRCLSEYS